MQNNYTIKQISEMTHEEITQAMECCVNVENCRDCGYNKLCDGTTVHQAALNLLKGYTEFEKGCFITGYENIKSAVIKEVVDKLKPYEERSCSWCKHSDNGKRSSKCNEVIDDTGNCVKLWCVGWQKFESILTTL